MTTVVVADLDRTLVYSAAALSLPGPDEEAPRLLCVEVYAGRPLSFVTEQAAADLMSLATSGVLVPATTRTVAGGGGGTSITPLRSRPGSAPWPACAPPGGRRSAPGSRGR